MKFFILTVLFIGSVYADNSLIVENLRKDIEKFGDNRDEVQNYFDHLQWGKIVEENAYSNAITIKEIKFNGHSRAIIVKPGEKIEGKLSFIVDRSKCRDMRSHRIILGFKDRGAQAAIGVGIGYFVHKDGKEKFTLTAPPDPGLYQVRFRHVQAFSDDDALAKWEDSKKRIPYSRTTVGFIYVKN